MTRPRKPRTPKYRKQTGKGGDRAFVELGGRRVYLGPYDSPESYEAYDRAIAEWAATRGRPRMGGPDLTLVELIAAYWEFAEQYYRRPDGNPTRELGAISLACGPLKKLYGTATVSEFGPKALKAVREQMIASGWCRKSINKAVGRIKRMVKWGVEEELIPASVLQPLLSVVGLRVGRSAARESDPILPIPDEIVQQTMNAMQVGLVSLVMQ